MKRTCKKPDRVRTKSPHDRFDGPIQCRACLALCGNTLEIKHTTTTPRLFEAPKASPPAVCVLATMEKLFSTTKGTNADVFSDPSHRMSKRPPPIKSGEGLGFEDFGSSFGPPKLVVTYGKSFKTKFKPAATLPTKPRKMPTRIQEDESDDEILLSSQHSIGSDATSSSKRVAKGKKPATPPDDAETVRVNGRVLDAHPDYKPSSFNALKGLRFTKTKKSVPDGDTVTEVPPPSSSLADSQDSSKSISDIIEILDDPPPRGPSKTSSTHHGSPSATRAAARQFTNAKNSSTSSTTTNDAPRSPARTRPRPRVVMKSAPPKRDSSPESTPRAAQKRDLHLCSKIPEQPTNAGRKRTVKEPTLPSSSRREPREFPLSLRAKENVSDGAWSGDASSSKTKKAVISRAATFVHTPKPIPLPSPLRTKPISRGITFPNLSPLSSSKDKGKARAKITNEDDTDLTDGLGKRGGPKPFPMSSQMLVGIDRRSKSPSIRSPKSTKRASSDDSGTEQGRTAKKRKDTRSGCVFFFPPFCVAHLFAVPNLFRVLDALDYLHEPMDDDSSKPPMFSVTLAFCSHTNSRIKLSWVTLETLQKYVPIATRTCLPIPHRCSNTCSQRHAKSRFRIHVREIGVV